MNEENRAVALRYVEEVVNGRNLAVADDLFAPDFRSHSADPGADPGIAGLIQFFVMLKDAFPDFVVVVDDLFGEEDRLAMRFTFHGTHQGEFMGMPPSNTRVVMPGIDILRIVNGKIVELWGQEDRLSLLMQLGAFPA